MKNKITINGVTIEVDSSNGSSINVRNGVVSVGGVVVQTGLSGVVEIIWSGPAASINADGSVTVNGEVKGDVDAGGSINCGNVSGSADAGGSINCGNIGGNADAGGSIRAGNIGSVKM